MPNYKIVCLLFKRHISVHITFDFADYLHNLQNQKKKKKKKKRIKKRKEKKNKNVSSMGYSTQNSST